MIHQPWGGTGGTAADIEIQARELGRNKQVLSDILAKHTGQTVDQVIEDSDRDFFMTPGQAKEYGLVDEVIDSLKGKAS